MHACMPTRCALCARLCVVQEDQRELAKTIRVSGSILLSTVSNFLDFFKIGELSWRWGCCTLCSWSATREHHA